MSKKIVFLGAGSMAEAMIAGILKAGIVDKKNIYVSNKQDAIRLDYMEKTYGVETTYDQELLINGADVIILAMKPKDLSDSLTSIRSFVNEKHLFISVIAGVMTETIEEILNMKVPVIRTMPNTSASIGFSATAMAEGRYVNKKHVAFAEELLQTIGITKIVLEEDMHSVTALSGSGPAFIYYFVEAMTKAALEAGMDVKTADELITQTIIGAGKMLEQSGDSAETLRKNITSQGGTTEAGLASLDQNEFQKIIMACFDSARNRSLDLAETYRTMQP